MLGGYARILTLDQNLDLQRDALRQAGCTDGWIVFPIKVLA
jgi:DNA invertase Pin-like site-specific DNA recombinase